MNIATITTWAVGLINGYKQKENGLPNQIIYGTMGAASIVNMMKVIGVSTLKPPGILMGGLFIGVPLVVGTTFCVGHHFGKAIRWAEDSSPLGKNQIRIKLL
jgi:hypothetical protein